jgi:hypothetical protein
MAASACNHRSRLADGGSLLGMTPGKATLLAAQPVRDAAKILRDDVPAAVGFEIAFL